VSSGSCITESVAAQPLQPPATGTSVDTLLQEQNQQQAKQILLLQQQLHQETSISGTSDTQLKSLTAQVQQLQETLEDRTQEVLEWQVHADVSSQWDTVYVSPSYLHEGDQGQQHIVRSVYQLAYDPLLDHCSHCQSMAPSF